MDRLADVELSLERLCGHVDTEGGNLPPTRPSAEACPRESTLCEASKLLLATCYFESGASNRAEMVLQGCKSPSLNITA